MNTLKMISEIKATCATLDTEKNDLAVRMKEIDDLLTGYRMAIDALELTMANHQQKPVETPAPVKEIPKLETVTCVVPSAPVQKTKYGHASMIECNGETKSLKEWAKELGLTPSGLAYRLNAGWKIEDAIRQPGQRGVSTVPRKKKPVAARKICKFDAMNNPLRQYMNLAAAASDLRMSEITIQKTIEHVSKADQLKAHNWYLDYAK